MSEKILVPVERLQRHCQGVLAKVGLREAHAALVAESLVFADRRGVASHGVVRLSAYLDRVRAGVMQVDPEMELVKDYPASGLLDARNGFGQIAGVKATDIAIQKAEKAGAGIVAVKNSNHFGAAAFFALRAVAADMIGLVLTNASPAMPPYNAKQPLLGTNPLAVAIPAGSQRPIVLDMATTVVARGKIRYVAARRGEKIPFGWAVDAEGKAHRRSPQGAEGQPGAHRRTQGGRAITHHRSAVRRTDRHRLDGRGEEHHGHLRAGQDRSYVHRHERRQVHRSGSVQAEHRQRHRANQGDALCGWDAGLSAGRDRIRLGGEASGGGRAVDG